MTEYFPSTRALRIPTGIAALLFQVIALLVVADFVPDVSVDGFLTALVGSFVYAIINTILTSVLALDQRGSYTGACGGSTALVGDIPRQFVRLCGSPGCICQFRG